MKLRFLLPPLLALAAGCARSPEQDLVESLCDNMLRTMDMPAVSNLVENLGADVNGRSDYRHCTPLYAAIQNGNEPPVRYAAEGKATNAMAVAVELGAAVDPRAGAHPSARSSAE